MLLYLFTDESAFINRLLTFNKLSPSPNWTRKKTDYKKIDGAFIRSATIFVIVLVPTSSGRTYGNCCFIVCFTLQAQSSFRITMSIYWNFKTQLFFPDENVPAHKASFTKTWLAKVGVKNNLSHDLANAHSRRIEMVL